MNACLTRLLVLAITVSSSSFLVGCITPTIRRPELRSPEKLALVSVHARRNMGLQDAQLGPMFALNTIGEEVIDISLATIEGDVETLFGEGRVLPPREAMKSKKYDLVPEAMPPEDWTQAQRMLAVDIDDVRTPDALAALGRDLGVSAVMVIRHEWSLSRDSYNRSFTMWAWDWCTVLVVDVNGVVLWREAANARKPLQMVWSNPFAVMGINATVHLDQARSLARDTARAAWNELVEAFMSVPVGAPIVPAANQPPPPLASPTSSTALPPPASAGDPPPAPLTP